MFKQGQRSCLKKEGLLFLSNYFEQVGVQIPSLTENIENWLINPVTACKCFLGHLLIHQHWVFSFFTKAERAQIILFIL